MKKILSAFALIMCISYLNAQEDQSGSDKQEEFKTIFGGKTVGGYGAIGLGYSVIEDKSAFVLNARGGVLINHWLGIGVAGAGFINDYKYNLALNKNVSLVGGYGGLLIESIVLPNSQVHISFPVLIGVGGVAYATFDSANEESGQSNSVEDTEAYFIFEPGAELEFNLFKFMRTAIFVSYRYVVDLDWPETSPGALNGLTGGIIFKFGKF